MKQHTLQTSVHLSGIGLHTGKTVTLMLHPAPENSGIVFRRVDVNPVITIPATTHYVSDTRFNTCLAKDNVSISTVEHVLSALAGLAIDNVIIDIDNCEPPVMDGSAWPFVALIQSAGIVPQSVDRQYIRIKRKITVEENDKSLSIAPSNDFKIAMTIDFDHPVIQQTQQVYHFDFSQNAYIEDISRARTFGFLSEYEYLKKNNLGLGASLDNTLVLNETDILNKDGLRDSAEFVKHKILDLMGDLYLLGYPVMGELTAYKSGHTLNHALRRALLNDKSSWDLVT